MSNDKSARQKKLSDMWTLTADAVLHALKADAPSAASLEVARKFLADNGCSLDTLRDWRMLGAGFFDPKQLPKFDDDNADDAIAPSSNTSTDPLKDVPPFADTDND